MTNQGRAFKIRLANYFGHIGDIPEYSEVFHGYNGIRGLADGNSVLPYFLEDHELKFYSPYTLLHMGTKRLRLREKSDLQKPL